MAMTFPSNPTTGQQYSVSGGPTYTWDGTVWKILTPGSQFSEQQFTATAGQTSFTVSGGYVIGAVDVYRNGVKLVIGLDFTATDLSTVVLTNAASAGDTIEVVKAAQILYADALKATNNLSDVGNAATALSNLGGLPKAGGTMTGLLNLGSVGQIQFPATQNPSSDANTLDDYEEGTWTPVLANTTATYTSRSGFYTKVGNVVTVWGNMIISGKTGDTGEAGLSGLPFASNSAYTSVSSIGREYLPAGIMPTNNDLFFSVEGTMAYIRSPSGSNNSYIPSSLANSGSLTFAITYRTAS